MIESARYLLSRPRGERRQISTVLLMKSPLMRRSNINSSSIVGHYRHQIKQRQCRYIHNIHHNHQVQITRDVPYSNKHSRNLMDIYKPHESFSNHIRRPPTLLFVHGGMWQRGSKDQSPIDMNDVVYSLWNSMRGENKTTRSIKDDERQKIAISKERHQSSNVSNTKTEFHPNRVGLTVAQHGGVAYVINYRLARGIEHDSEAASDLEGKGEGHEAITPDDAKKNTSARRCEEDEDTAAHPGQVMDVARAIVDVARRELAARKEILNDKRTQNNHQFKSNIFLCGHSAGAHLVALALSNPKYIQQALAELKIEDEVEKKLTFVTMENVRGILAGFVGVSGVYNLRRLATSALADVVIGPAFYRGKESKDGKNEVVAEASPVHALLDAHANLSPPTKPGSKSIFDKRNKTDACNAPILCNDPQIPLLVNMPVLLLNAESDFHLQNDAKDLMVALGQFNETHTKQTLQKQQYINHKIIPGTNHLSIMGQFGSGLLVDNEVNREETTPANEENQWTLTNLALQSYNVLGSASSSIMTYFSGDGASSDGSTLPVDETAKRLLEFLSLIPSRQSPLDSSKDN